MHFKLIFFQDYHPYQFAQCTEETTKKFESFSEAVDEFLSKVRKIWPVVP